MRVIDCQQGSTEWLQARAGIPTASCFDKIVTPKTGKPSSQAERYMYRLLAERMLGRPILEPAVTSWMSRGTELESEAVSFYEAQREMDTVRVGFLTNEDGTIGASPDRIVGDVGLLEIKCPSEAVHVGYLLNRHVDQEYLLQVQGQLWISGREWCDVLSYHPEMPPCIIRVERDERVILMLSDHVGAFALTLADAVHYATENGWIKA